MVAVDVYSDLVGGRAAYHADTLYQLKERIQANLGRSYIDWFLYKIYVNDKQVGDGYYFNHGDIVKIMNPGNNDSLTHRENYKVWGEEYANVVDARITASMESITAKLAADAAEIAKEREATRNLIEAMQIQMKMTTGLLEKIDATPIKRLFLEPQIDRPKFNLEVSGKKFVGTLVCGTCGGPLPENREIKRCIYCGALINWYDIPKSEKETESEWFQPVSTI